MEEPEDDPHRSLRCAECRRFVRELQRLDLRERDEDRLIEELNRHVEARRADRGPRRD
jgi:hypothetical protein